MYKFCIAGEVVITFLSPSITGGLIEGEDLSS